MKSTLLFRIEAPGFVAGGEIYFYTVVRAAPILKRTVGWTVPELQEFCIEQKWKFDLYH